MEELKGKKLYHKGITMIALIITVIVLLLLAGIAIANLVGENGTLKKSKKAADDYLYSQAKEEIEIAVNSAIIVSERRKKEITFKQALQEEFNLEPLYTNNVSNIKEATTEVIGTNREVYRYKINLETGEITDLKIEEQEGKEYKITASRGKWIEKNGIIYIPTWHPAALLRDETKKIDFWKDLKEAIRRLEEIKKEVN